MVRLRRRDFLASAFRYGVVVAAPALVSCDVSRRDQRRRYRVGFLSHHQSVSSLDAQTIGIVRQTFNDLGYVEDGNLSFFLRYAEGDESALGRYATELLAIPVDVLMTEAAPATLAAQKATDTVPTVFFSVNDPVGLKIVTSLSEPGRNITGVATLSGALSAKRLEYFKTTIPTLMRVAVLWNSSNPGQELVMRDTTRGAALLGLAMRTYGIRDWSDLDAALDAIDSDPADGLLVLANMDDYGARIVDFAMRHQLPHMFSSVPGAFTYRALMAFGPDYHAQTRRAVMFVDKILRGARPGDIPVEDPTTFLLAVDLAVARRLAITIPPAILRDATEVRD